MHSAALLRVHSTWLRTVIVLCVNVLFEAIKELIVVFCKIDTASVDQNAYRDNVDKVEVE